MMKTTYSIEDLSETAKQIIQKSKSKIILFYAKMGVGKTTLIKEISKQLGSDDVVSSPTFSLVNEYASENGPLFHFDFYRIEEEVEALDIGVEEYFDNDHWVFIEWPEKIPNLLPEDAQKIVLKRIDKNKNFIEFN